MDLKRPSIRRILIVSGTITTCVCLVAQTNCPILHKADGTLSDGEKITVQGLMPGANVTTVVLSNSVGTFSPDQVGDVQTADQNYANALGSTDTTITADSASGFANNTDPSNLVHEVQLGTQDDVNKMGQACVRALACTTYNFNQYGFVTYISTVILESAAATGLLEQLETHEDSHGMGGLAHCVGCPDTTANPDITPTSPPAPTDCDKLKLDPPPCPTK